ncbi:MULTISPECIES: DUF6504 family protein [Nocardiopsis]|uniref:DUF6504 family protein n=1 Tax=Nocardiopsis lambiniae TaxID=3075539 RepID=A0ABU2MGF8_9ACTN|nr:MULTISPECIES: DUF6504 family protein [unclassified Nocardiopsis]MDE3721472.1 DUF6504 family protein [Nocardiopsis sp. N85]MDT0331789.1 DUF6504 family protein [Nocardiopsis sp. DSM 44743]
MPRGSVVGRYYGAEVTVVEDAGRPARFTWNGRVYGVRRIIDHWVAPHEDRRPVRGPRPARMAHWRLEAGAAGSEGVYELRHDIVAGTWSLSRVWG